MRSTRPIYTLRVLRIAVAVAVFVIAAPAFAAGIGDRCKVPTTNPTYLCPLNAPCLQAIGNKYCSNAGKVCGWPDKGGYNLEKQKQYKGKWYECFPNGFQRVYNDGASCSSNSQCKNHNCGGSAGEMTCGGTAPAPAVATPEQMIAGLKAAGVPLPSILAAVMEQFEVGGAEMATMLRVANFAPTMSGAALKDSYDPSLETLGDWMLGAGWSVGSVAATLKGQFTASASQIASFLKSSGQSALETAGILHDLFSDLSREQAAVALKFAGYTVAQTMPAIQTVFNVSLSVAAATAQTVGYTWTSIVDVMVAIEGATVKVIEFALDNTPNSKQALTTTVQMLEQAGAIVDSVRQVAVKTGKWSAALIESVLAGIYNLAASAPSDATAPGSRSMVGSSGNRVGFPDVCRTPSPAGPIPIPYPNLGFLNLPGTTGSKTKTSDAERVKDAVLKHSEFRAGSYRLRSGETLVIRPTTTVRSGGAPPAAKIAVADSKGQERSIRSSTLLEMPDGGFCAVCMVRGRVSSIRLLTPVRKERSRQNRKR